MPFCKNCNNLTKLDSATDRSRVEKGLCVACYKAIKQNRKTVIKITPTPIGHPDGQLWDGPEVKEYFCRNCSKRTNGRPESDEERIEQKLCKRCFRLWEINPYDDEWLNRAAIGKA